MRFFFANDEAVFSNRVKKILGDPVEEKKEEELEMKTLPIKNTQRFQIMTEECRTKADRLDGYGRKKVLFMINQID